MKYNMSEINRAAWVLKKAGATWSEAMISAYAQARQPKTINQIVTWAEKQIENSDYASTGYAEYWYNSDVREWKKGNGHMIYINLNYGRTGKWSRGVSYGINLNTKEIRNVSTKYNNAAEREFVLNLCNQIVEMLA